MGEGIKQDTVGLKIVVADLWKAAENRVLLDVRTPAEYLKGHVPTAMNLPMFTDEERAVVGTTYKQESPFEALLKGLDYVGPKMRQFLERVADLAPDRRLLLYCWRGGRRSASMAWLFETAGFDVRIVEGGYKAYRRFVLDSFYQQKANIIVLGGRTGCGKTAILKALGEAGEQIIDLESLAHHKGSSFGAIGELPQPSVEYFENYLFQQLQQLDLQQRIWIENESRSIGRIYIPQGFWDQMKKAPLINIEMSFDLRVSILVEVYAAYPKSELVEAFQRIKKKLGGQHLQRAMEALDTDNFATAAGIALRYYDKSYQYMLDNNAAPNIYLMPVEENAPVATAAKLVEFANQSISSP